MHGEERDQAEIGGMGRHLQPRGLGQLRDPEGAADAADIEDIGLGDIDDALAA